MQGTSIGTNNVNLSITLLALIPLPFMAFLTYRIGKKVHDGFREVQEQTSVSCKRIGHLRTDLI